MSSTKFQILLFAFASVFASAAALPARADTEQTKRTILKIAQSYQGQGDSDGSKQRRLEKLVTKLLRENPQAPVSHRLPLLYGAWKQVWGPYDYRSNDRGVDPALDPANIIQVIFKDGYYYNVNPTRTKKGKAKGITLLRGEFVQDPEQANHLNVRFTNLRRLKGPMPTGLRLQDLPELSEVRSLSGERTVLPAFFVRLFFGGGTLNEVYTDHDLRILFGSGRDGGPGNYIYVMKRLQ